MSVREWKLPLLNDYPEKWARQIPGNRPWSSTKMTTL